MFCPFFCLILSFCTSCTIFNNNNNKDSDHLQLIKFWLSRAPGKGVCSGAKSFGSALLQPAARSVCVSLSAYFITLRAKLTGAVYCYQSCLFVCNGRAVFGGGSVTSITRNCVHRFSQNCRVCGLQLIKFGRPAPPGRGSAAGRQFLDPAYYSQRAVFASL